MTLPNVSGWMIDYRTAKSIFESGSNERVSHCIDLCNCGRLFITHQEEKRFKDHPLLGPVFLEEGCCLIIPDQTVRQTALSVSAAALEKPKIEGNDSAIFITAIAASRNLGVISDHRSAAFSTVVDYCEHFHIPVYPSNLYFAEAL